MSTSNGFKAKAKTVLHLIGGPMEPEKSFASTWAFRLSVSIPPAIAVFLVVTSSIVSGLKPCLSAEGFQFFYDHFKLPIGIFSLAIPLGALVAAHHRSLQTSKQIEKQEAQNIFGNHLEHKKSFREFMEEIKPLDRFECWNSWQIYEALFPNASEGRLDAKEDAKDLILAATGFYKNLEAIINRAYDGRSNLSAIDDIPFLTASIHTNIYNLSGIELSLKPINPPEYIYFKEISDEIHEACNGLISCANFQNRSINSEIVRAFEKSYTIASTKIREIKFRKEAAFEIQEIFKLDSEMQGEENEKLTNENRKRLYKLLDRLFKNMMKSRVKIRLSKILEVDIDENLASSVKKNLPKKYLELLPDSN